MLRSIPKSDVQKICSGQSVVDLATAVKELVENSLDAGATTIEIKLKEFGQLGFEVSDNGKGISSEDHAAIALKHYTSKIQAFEDLENVSSFGFRGEALSSICQLARSFTVLTRTKDDSIGTLLQYDHGGALVSSTKKARGVGTTVIVEDLFHPLPVRYKDFVKNIKKHYGKTLRVLQGYALISSKVKISCINVTGKNNQRQEVISTQANQTVADNIANVFGSKFLKTLLVVDIPVPLGDDKIGQIAGFVSKVGVGVGRSDNDRQFFFVNGRPVDLLQATKAVNEVWRQYEMKQKPACVLNFVLPAGTVDVNVTPDKRETFIKDEVFVVECLKEGLNSMYEPSRGTFQVQSLLPVSSVNPKTLTIPSSPKVKRQRDTYDSEVPATAVQLDEDNLLTPTPAKRTKKDASNISETIGHETQSENNVQKEPNHDKNNVISEKATESLTTGVVSREKVVETNELLTISQYSPPHTPAKISTMEQPKSPPTDWPPSENAIENSHDEVVVQTPATAVPAAKIKSAKQEPNKRQGFMISKYSMRDVVKQRKFFFSQQKKRSQLPQRKRSIPTECGAEGTENGEEAISSLQRVLSKDDFRRMEVVGQFNMGFIIARLDSDLFIIDQHASDEKFRYETLQKTTIIHQQPLVRPMSLQLTAIEEMTILDHHDVFKKQGFHFQVDESANVTEKLKLISVPFSKQTQWGVDDVRELVSLLLESPNTPATIRLPKTLAMFASRACRSAVMIGKALKRDEMQKIVLQLAELEQPWNCPHGRPTMRHLVDLSEIGQMQ
ncbi:unnamed protein product [Aphanomyces euteiches]